MPPGRKVRAANRQPEVSTTEYEKARALTVMRNNQMLRILGLTGLTSLIQTSKTRKNCMAPEGSDPLYEHGHNEDSEDDVVDQAMHDSMDVPFSNRTRNTTMSIGTGATKGSKRVIAPEAEDQISRVTRQKTKELSSAVEELHGPATQAHEHAVISANCSAQLDEEIQICDEGQTDDINHWNRGKTIGRELDRITRGLCTKIPVIVAEGKRRPEAPMQAAKLASEAGIQLRNHFPILTHWKEYKKDASLFDDYIGKISGQFAIDTKNKAVREACTDLMRCSQQQMRYRLKKAYFNGVPADKVRTTSPLPTMTDKQWRELVEMWSAPTHKEKCQNNKLVRGKVQFQQRTGSRSYIVHAHVVKQQKYKDVPPTAIDLFKECHCSSKTGFAEPVKEAIATMEALVAEPVIEGQDPKTPTEVVAHVLNSSKFLQNVGLASGVKRSSNSVDATRVRELEAELEAEKQGSAEVRVKLDALQKKVAESEEARSRELKKIENMQKGMDETNALLRRLFSFSKE